MMAGPVRSIFRVARYASSGAIYRTTRSIRRHSTEIGPEAAEGRVELSQLILAVRPEPGELLSLEGDSRTFRVMLVIDIATSRGLRYRREIGAHRGEAVLEVRPLGYQTRRDDIVLHLPIMRFGPPNPLVDLGPGAVTA